MPDADCEGLIHRVTSRKLEDRGPMPSGSHDWELSWSRSGAVMRLSLKRCPCCHLDYTWECKEMVGPMIFAYTDKDAGRFILRGRAKYKHMDGDPIVQFWRPKNG